MVRRGVPDKNIKFLGGYPLLAYSITAAKLAGIERVVVSTDSENYAEVATRFRAEVPFLRPAVLSGDKSTDYEFMHHAMSWIKNTEGEVPEYWVHLRPTTPFRNINIIEKAIEKIISCDEIRSLRSAHKVDHNPFKWFMKDEKGFFKGILPNLDAEKINLPRQQFPTVYIPNGYIDIVKSSVVLSNHKLHGEKMYVFETEKIEEIDNEDDFYFLEYKVKENKIEIWDYINEFSRI